LFTELVAKINNYNAPDRQTDSDTRRPTDGIGDITCTNTRLRSVDYSDAASDT